MNSPVLKTDAWSGAAVRVGMLKGAGIPLLENQKSCLVSWFLVSWFDGFLVVGFSVPKFLGFEILRTQ